MANEKRLIDAKRLRESVITDYYEHYTQCHTTDQIALMDMVEYCIEEQPTVDAVEVVHGHWISLTDCSNAGVYCSVCNKKVWKEDYAWCNRKNRLRSNYCPNCGAKMDL